MNDIGEERSRQGEMEETIRELNGRNAWRERKKRKRKKRNGSLLQLERRRRNR